jgi:alkanesulfonate monooxygenase SsuD/methylene tetrahydromethanopterin reductase-like flavin-dependent oxidoreductase (luciferase family)
MVVRQHPRFHASFSGTLTHRNQRHAISRSLDLSRKGCRVHSSFPAFAGMKVDLQLIFPGSQTPILIQGAVVRWAGSQGIGIEFLSLASPDEQQLEGTLRLLAAKASHSPQPVLVSGRA